ncbi:hypothetical protein NY588_09495 [Curtobacterium flaccumfaciens pv. beticola]|uniref:hypothetical protein n=1 Tax=Curtobacterium flaccumfaciens TaxID=2035 RepID=UPI00349F2AA2|nr:hypothetical protein [Curtobacterium flaccumfaciens pv. basellae]
MTTDRPTRVRINVTIEALVTDLVGLRSASADVAEQPDGSAVLHVGEEDVDWAASEAVGQRVFDAVRGIDGLKVLSAGTIPVLYDEQAGEFRGLEFPPLPQARYAD